MSGLDMVKMKETVDALGEEGLLRVLGLVESWPFSQGNSGHVEIHFEAGDWIVKLESGKGYVTEHVTRFLKDCAQARSGLVQGW